MLRCSAITKRFGDLCALDGVDLEIGEHEVVGFVGRNGAGKTTTMRVIMGLLEPEAGSVSWNGQPIAATDRRQIGYMPEERGLYPKMRCIDQLAYFAQLAGVPKRAAVGHAASLLESFGLTDRSSDAVEKLSLGNQQRVQLAAALVGEPKLLILDEPFSGLDPVGVDALTQMLSERTHQGIGMLFSSHQLELIERLADRVVIIDAGRVLTVATVDPNNRGALAEQFRELIATRADASPAETANNR
jgi:ABC-2 type transport system ATP-binding protein